MHAWGSRTGAAAATAEMALISFIVESFTIVYVWGWEVIE